MFTIKYVSKYRLAESTALGLMSHNRNPVKKLKTATTPNTREQTLSRTIRLKPRAANTIGMVCEKMR